MKDVRTVCLCDECSVGVANGDWSSIDYHFGADTEASNREYARIQAMLEVLGWLSHFGPADAPGYFTCDLCDDIQCSGGTLFAIE